MVVQEAKSPEEDGYWNGCADWIASMGWDGVICQVVFNILLKSYTWFSCCNNYNLGIYLESYDKIFLKLENFSVERPRIELSLETEQVLKLKQCI